MNQDQSKTDGAAPVSSTPLFGPGSPVPRCQKVEQCECCASPLGTPIQVEHTTRIMCDKCLGFIARWLVELDPPNKEVSSGAKTP